MHDHPNRPHCTPPLNPAQEVEAARAALTAAVDAPDGPGSSARIDQATRRYIAASHAWREEQRVEAEKTRAVALACFQGPPLDPVAPIASLRARRADPAPSSAVRRTEVTA